MTTLEKIKAEIEDARYGLINDGLDVALKIIDKYAEKEPNRDMEEIWEIMKSDADAETKCKMISNILTTKPHYFAEQEPCDNHEEKPHSLLDAYFRMRAEQECEDAVSRQAVMKSIDKWYENNNQLLLNNCVEDLIVDVMELPSVQPKAKTVEPWNEPWIGEAIKNMKGEQE